MPIGQIHLASNTPSTNGDEESNDQTEDGDNVIVDEETKFIPSRLVDKAGRLNIRTEELDIRNPFTFRNAIRLRWGMVIQIYVIGKLEINYIYTYI